MTDDVDQFKAQARKHLVEKMEQINPLNPTDEVRLLVALRALGATLQQQREIIGDDFEKANAWLADFEFYGGKKWNRLPATGGLDA